MHRTQEVGRSDSPSSIRRAPRRGGAEEASAVAGRARERPAGPAGRQQSTDTLDRKNNTSWRRKHQTATLTARRRVYHCHVPHQAALPRTLPRAWPLRVPPRPRRDTSQHHRPSIRAVQRHAGSLLGWRAQATSRSRTVDDVGRPSARRRRVADPCETATTARRTAPPPTPRRDARRGRRERPKGGRALPPGLLDGH